MNFNIKDFTGPLDLMLHMVKKHELDIYEIDLKIIIDEYINFINSLDKNDLDNKSEYLVMASELIHLKSKIILGFDEEEDDDNYEINSEEDLRNRLIEYEKYQTKHQELWSSLYKQFPSILLEQKYQNEDATNSLELLQMAKLAMQDFNNIEREYNITTIDTFALKGYEGQQINIGDSIALNAEELYTGFDDIKESLKQYLFVTDISYTLRQDTDVNLTVNKIKYQDKMIQQLAKLIK